jgi:hypothetical protein
MPRVEGAFWSKLPLLGSTGWIVLPGFLQPRVKLFDGHGHIDHLRIKYMCVWCVFACARAAACGWIYACYGIWIPGSSYDQYHKVTERTVIGRCVALLQLIFQCRTFAENVTVRSGGEIMLALYPSRVVMCSSESLELLDVVDGYCKNIFVEYLAEFSQVIKYYVHQVWVHFIVYTVMTVPLISAWAEDVVVISFFIVAKRLLPSEYMYFFDSELVMDQACVCFFYQLYLIRALTQPPYSYAFSLAVCEFAMYLSIERLFHRFIVHHCITVRDKEDNALIVEVFWLNRCWQGHLNAHGNMDDTSLCGAFCRLRGA